MTSKTNTQRAKITISRNDGGWVVTETVSPEFAAQSPNMFGQRYFVTRCQAREYARTRRLASK
jgi:hypothetical protein